MNELHTIPMPARIARLPRDDRGYPVPWFVAVIDGAPDFRVIGPDRVKRAIIEGRCWLCGEVLGRYEVFVIGPMCAVNRISSEPPCHRECAEYAARVCPFLARPHARRREGNLPEDVEPPPGQMIRRNPGVALLWVTTSFRFVSDGRGGVLFEVGEPVDVRWYAEGRPATRVQVLESIQSGLPLLEQEARKDGPDAERALQYALTRALRLIPADRPE